MRITHVSTGEDYQLRPGTQIEMERTNPFFNDYGEQSVPLTLPDTPKNRLLLGNPDKLSNTNRPGRTIDSTIQDGEYYMPCRQAVLSYQEKEGISTSFYMNDGSMYTRLQKVMLKKIVEGEFVEGVNTVQEGIDFCKSLVSHGHAYYDIFPVLVTDDSNSETAGYTYKFINAYGFMANDVFRLLQLPDDPPLLTPQTLTFYNEVERTEVVDGEDINLSPGYYMSPFVRCNHVLQRIFQYFGYTLQSNFFATTAPFNKMVFMNNTMDALVNGKIRIADLLPDVSCSDVLDFFRKKFHCEFIPDEKTRTIEVKLFNEVVQSPAQADLTPYCIGSPSVEYPDKYKQVVLHASGKVGSEEATESFDTLTDLLAKYPEAQWDAVRGYFYRIGFSGSATVTEKLSECSMDYNLGDENYEEESIEIPECIPELRTATCKSNAQQTAVFLYVGDYQVLNSKMKTAAAAEDGSDEEESDKKDKKTGLMAAVPYTDAYGYPRGTVTEYDYQAYLYEQSTVVLFNYSLCYWGERGIFEKFWRSYDSMARNSFHPVKAELLLPQSLKLTLKSHMGVVIDNALLYMDKLKYTIGGKNEPVESELLTTRLYEPVTLADLFTTRIPYTNAGYHWEYRSEDLTGTTVSMNEDGQFHWTLPAVFPPPPSSSYVGQRFFERVYVRCLGYKIEWPEDGKMHMAYKMINTWIECVPNI